MSTSPLHGIPLHTRLRSLPGQLVVVSRLLTAALLLAACSSATDSGPPPNPQPTHPERAIDERLPVSGGVNGIAITKAGTMIVSRYDSNDVVFGNVGSLTVSGELPIGLHPGDVVLSPDERTAYVTNYGTPTVAIIDVASRQQTGVLTVADAPRRILVTPDGNRVYISNSGHGTDTTAVVYDFDAHTRALLDTIIVGVGANGIAFDSAHSKLYVTSVDEGKVFEIDANADTVTTVLETGAELQEVVVLPDRSEFWVADEVTGIRIFDLTYGIQIGTVPTTAAASRLALTRDGVQVYETAVGDTTVSIIDVSQRRIVKAMYVGGSPQQIAFDALGSHAVITEPFSGRVLVK
jgi:YVTN family beta-propeller protein